MFICAMFSAKYGWWNEQMTSDRSFVTALKHIVKANVLAMLEILKRRADAIFIQSRILGIFPRRQPEAIHAAELMNSRRFLSLDLNYGRRVDSEMYEYLFDNGMTREEYHFFLAQPAEAALHPRQRLLPDQRAPGVRGRPYRPRRAKCSATPRSRGNITTATGCR